MVVNAAHRPVWVVLMRSILCEFRVMKFSSVLNESDLIRSMPIITGYDKSSTSKTLIFEVNCPKSISNSVRPKFLRRTPLADTIEVLSNSIVEVSTFIICGLTHDLLAPESTRVSKGLLSINVIISGSECSH